MVHYLERVSDHGVGIGATTIFLVSGERIGDDVKQDKDRDLGER
jgi:phosphate transport system protein